MVTNECSKNDAIIMRNINTLIITYKNLAAQLIREEPSTEMPREYDALDNALYETIQAEIKHLLRR